MRKALILVDMENEWIDKNSDYYVGDISDMIKKTNSLIDFCRNKEYKIIFIQHIEKDSDLEFAEGTEKIEIINDLRKENSDITIRKNKISAFYKTNLEKELVGIKEIVICGILTNLCVRSLAEGAYDRDFDISIIEDCCVAMNKEIHNFTLEDLKETREEIKILNSGELIK